LGNLQNGVQINLRKLNSAIISAEDTFVTVGGGIISDELRDMLWAANKQTTHGLCECTGLVAPALGGGHGILQGKYGLMSDQFLALDVVLANGSLIRIDAERHQELFWAMQGAGHNFGIVTSADYKIYDVPETEIGGRIWSHRVFTYEATEENLRKVYGAAKELLDHDEHPEGLKILGSISRGPEPSRVPMIAHHVSGFCD
jgi:FAD/FMN-containing dehydrogenase